MKTNLFTIALAVATMVPAFAAQAQTPAQPADPSASTSKPAAVTTKKHHKKAKKNAAKPAAAATTTAKPAGSSK